MNDLIKTIGLGEFLIPYPDGTPGAILTLEEGVPKLALLNKDGMIRVEVVLLKGLPSVKLYDKDGTRVVELTLKGGKKGWQNLLLCSVNPGVKVSLWPDGREEERSLVGDPFGVLSERRQI